VTSFSAESSSPTCFIIGPIGDRLEPAGAPGKVRYENAIQMWEAVFEPACTELGLRPIRADKITESGEIPEQIFLLLRDADVVVADVSSGNANVMYELGLRHTRDKITIQIGEHEHLPFDINTIRTIKFKRTEAGLIDARNSLTEALKVALEGGGTPVTATRLWNEGKSVDAATLAASSARSVEAEDPLDQDDDDVPGILDQLATGEVAMERVSEIMTEVTERIEELGALTKDSTPAVESSESFAGRLTVMRKLVDQLNPTAQSLDSLSDEYTQRVDEIDAMVRVVVDQTHLSEEPLEAEAWTYFESLFELSKSAEEATVGLTGMLAAVRDMRQWSKLFRNLSKSLERSLNRILRGNAVITGWQQLLESLPDWDERPERSSSDES
jgi:hypothetical protein